MIMKKNAHPLSMVINYTIVAVAFFYYTIWFNVCNANDASNHWFINAL